MSGPTGTFTWCGVAVTWDSFSRCWRGPDGKYRCRSSVVWHSPHEQSEPTSTTKAPPSTAPEG